MKKSIITISIIAVIAAALILATPSVIESLLAFHIDREKSSFIDYSVKDDKVYIECSITVRNTDAEEVNFLLYSTLMEDVKGGLLKNGRLQGYSDNFTDTVFTLGGESTQSFTVFFIGDFAGTHIKHDRNLPEISYIIFE